MKGSKKNKTVGMVGVGGSGMRGLAYLLGRSGTRVVGTDAQMEKTKGSINNDQIELVGEKEFAQQLALFDEIIFSDAVSPEHRLRRAVKNEKVVSKYHEAVGKFAQNYRVLAITGTHGKSSTTAMAAHILIGAGLDPTVLLGASMPEWEGRHARFGQSNLMLLEADEYREHFLTLTPDLIAITAIDFDHPDYFKSLKQTEAAYSKFIEQRKAEGVVVTLETVKRDHPDITWPANTVALKENMANGLEMKIPGWHMKTNGLIALSIATHMGVDEVIGGNLLMGFSGIKRRFEYIGQWGGMDIISDYGHHPTEIANTIRAARDKYGVKKILVILEPHTKERIREFTPQFVTALQSADGVVLAPLYMPEGREAGREEISELQEELNVQLRKQGKLVGQMEDLGETRDMLEKMSENYTVALAFSAGSLDAMLRETLGSK